MRVAPLPFLHKSIRTPAGILPGRSGKNLPTRHPRSNSAHSAHAATPSLAASTPSNWPGGLYFLTRQCRNQLVATSCQLVVGATPTSRQLVVDATPTSCQLVVGATPTSWQLVGGATPTSWQLVGGATPTSWQLVATKGATPTSWQLVATKDLRRRADVWILESTW